MDITALLSQNLAKTGATGQPATADGEAFAAYFEKAAQSKWRRASHLVAICRRRQRPRRQRP